MTYDPAANSIRCHSLAIASLREINIRNGNIQPSSESPDEQRWASEGPVPIANLESVKRSVA